MGKGHFTQQYCVTAADGITFNTQLDYAIKVNVFLFYDFFFLVSLLGKILMFIQWYSGVMVSDRGTEICLSRSTVLQVFSSA